HPAPARHGRHRVGRCVRAAGGVGERPGRRRQHHRGARPGPRTAGGEPVTATGPETGAFSAETYQNEYLAAGAATVDAVVTVSAAGHPDGAAAAVTASGRAEVIIVDVSGSMGHGRKMAAAREAAAAAVDSLADGVSFAVIAGDHEAKLIWPSDGRSFAV